jgi:NDP-sugar pyrophosphorylase family protein
MKAMILAAGLGTRLRPLTLERAKPAAPFMRRPIILRLVDHLRALGVSGFRINLHHLPETVEEVFEASDNSVSFMFEPEILGTGGGLKNNETYFDDEPFLMVNGDIVTSIDLKPLIDFHLRERPLATMALMEQEPPYEHFPVRIDEAFNLHNFKGLISNGRPLDKRYAFIGAHIIDAAIFDFIPPQRHYDINSQAYVKAMRVGKRVCGFPLKGWWNDLGDPVRYLEAHINPLTECPGISLEERISPKARIDPSTIVDQYSVIGDGCEILGEAVVSNSVLWENVKVDESARLENCLVGSSVKIDKDRSNEIITNNGARTFQSRST